MGNTNHTELPQFQGVPEDGTASSPEVFRDRLVLEGIRIASAHHDEVRHKLTPEQNERRRRTLDEARNAITGEEISRT